MSADKYLYGLPGLVFADEQEAAMPFSETLARLPNPHVEQPPDEAFDFLEVVEARPGHERGAVLGRDAEHQREHSDVAELLVAADGEFAELVRRQQLERE